MLQELANEKLIVMTDANYDGIPESVSQIFDISNRNRKRNKQKKKEK